MHDIKEFLAKKSEDGQKVEVTLTSYDNYITRYSKNHYNGTGDLINDLKIIISKVCNLKREDISSKEIYNIVFNVWDKWVLDNTKAFLVRNLFYDVIRMKESINYKEVIEKMLSDISLTQMIFDDREIKFSDLHFQDLNNTHPSV